MRLFFEPADFLFFRDNKPFAGGESFSGISRDLPLPQVLYGALRTLLLQEAGVDFSRFARFKSLDEAAATYPVVRATGLPDIAGSLRIRGPYLAELYANREDASLFFPQPLDVVKYDEEDASNGYGLLAPEPNLQGISNLPAPYLQPLMVKGRRKTADFDNTFFPTNLMADYLRGEELGIRNTRKGNLNKAGINRLSDLVQSEGRIGIAISENWVSERSRFYILEGRRLEERIGMVVEFEGVAKDFIPSFTNQFMHLGGERRFGRITQIEADDIPGAPSNLSKKFKLVLVTPALFKGGWLPGWLDKATGQGFLPGSDLRVQLVAAAVGRPVVLSGYDVSRNQPKPLRRGVPAGSVYYIELLEGDPAQLVSGFHNANSISDEDGQAGFGLSLVGKW